MKNDLKQQVNKSISELYLATKQMKEMQEKFNELKKKTSLEISNYMFTLGRGVDSFQTMLDSGLNFYSNHVNLKVTRVRKKKYIWDLGKLKKKMKKENYKKVVQKTYTVNDMVSLVEYLKSCGVDPKKFKSYIDVTETVDEKEINNLYDLGKLKREEFEGCYKIEFSDPYIRLTEQKTEQE